jgi:hypothetical protein
MSVDDDANGSERESPLPLAWGQHGDPISVPEDAAGWRVRRLKPGSGGGAPEVVYEAGRPLILPIDATPDELVERVNGRPGRYRLDAVDDAGKPVKATPAYTVIEREPTPPPQAHEVAADAMCPNCKMLIQTIVQLAGDMRQIATTAVTQSAPMISAASSVIVPEKRRVEVVAERIAEQAQGFDWGTFLTTAAPMLQQALLMLTQKASAPQVATTSGS